MRRILYSKGIWTLLALAGLPTIGWARSCTMAFRGYQGNSALENFQALVKLPAAAPVFSYGDCPSENDIWFSDEQGNLIPHEIDTWNAAGDSYIWVKVPKVVDSTTYITMHWGEARPAGQTVTATAVWTGCKGVWHMSESEGTAADSTGNNLDGTPSGLAPTDMVADAGVVGNARVNARSMGNGVGYLSIPSYTLGNTFTVSGWFKAFGTFSDYERIFSRKEDWTKAGWEVYFCQHPAKVGLEGNNSTQVNNLPIPSVLNDWVNIVAVYSGSTCSLYANGVRVGGGTVAAPTDNKLPLSIGSSSNGSYNSFYGKYDEVRLTGSALSPDRINADYLTVHDPVAFLCARDEDANRVDTAEWIGGGNPANLLDPANWRCLNATGGVIAAGVPTSACTRAVIRGAVNFQLPADRTEQPWKRLVLDNMTLTADADWRGLNPVATEIVGRINLDGHVLYLAEFPQHGLGEIISTDGHDYIELDYLQQDDNKGYIDTGFQHDANTVVDLRIAPMVLPSAKTAWESLFGARINNSQPTTFSMWMHSVSNEVAPLVCCYYTSVNGSAGDNFNVHLPQALVPVEIHLEKSGPCTLDGELLATGSGGGCGLNDYIFCVNDNGKAAYFTTARLYSCVIRSGASVVRDFVPVLRMSTGELGLLDRQANVFYDCKGGGRFEGGGPRLAGRTLAEVHIDVPAGKTVVNGTTRLTGLLKVFKEGAGRYGTGVDYQYYAGGTCISGGSIFASNPPGERLQFGLAETEMRVCEGATLEVNGQHSFYCHKIVAAGGGLQNTGGNVSGSWAQWGDVALETNTTVNVQGNYGFIAYSYAPARLDLGGHTLTVNLASKVSSYFYLFNTEMTSGRFEMASGGWLNIDKAGLEARTVDFIVKCALDIKVPAYVRGYSAQCPSNFNKGTAPLNVYGTFEPVTDYFYGCTLQNGATLDLSGKTQTWSTTGAFTNGLNTVVFADHATVTIELGNRKPKDGELVVSWDEAPENRSTLSFVRPKGRMGKFYTTDEGIVFSLGMIILVR